MTDDEITKLWEQSSDDAEGMRLGYTTQQHYFAALVAAAEREACEEVASDYADYQRSLGDEYAELRAMGALEVMDKISARRQE